MTTTHRTFTVLIPGFGAILLAAALSTRVSEYDTLHLFGIGQVGVRDLIPWLSAVSFAALLGLSYLARSRHTSFLVLLASLATTLAIAVAFRSFLLLPTDVGQPPWQPSTNINAAAVLLSTVVLWIAVLIFLRHKGRFAFVVALAAVTVEISVVPFVRPVWSQLR